MILFTPRPLKGGSTLSFHTTVFINILYSAKRLHYKYKNTYNTAERYTPPLS